MVLLRDRLGGSSCDGAWIVLAVVVVSVESAVAILESGGRIE